MNVLLAIRESTRVMKRLFSTTHISFLSTLVILLHLHLRSSAQELRAATPPRGWNSYDSFCWTISEEEFLNSATIVAGTFKQYGYEYVVVDYLWYRKKVPGASVDSRGFDVIDEWGRMMPDPGRWPSASRVDGFIEVASKVHAMNLKFGIHVMRGISRQAVDANTPILDINTGRPYEEGGRVWRAQDIALKDKPCAWMKDGFVSVDTTLGAGKAFLSSLYHQYAYWGVDFVKHDCVFGDDLDINEITFVSEVIKGLDHPIVYSLSPGTSATPAMARQVSGLVNMYRITGDDWDTWNDVLSHFDVSRDFASNGMIGASGLSGNSWPDLDMLPLGWLTDPASNEGPHRSCRLTIHEQKTQVTLWAMAKSPLMFGGDIRNLDVTTFLLIAQLDLLEINAFSSNNKEFLGITESVIPESEIKKSDEQESETEVLGLTTCDDVGTNGWSVNRGQVCWKSANGSRYGDQERSFCFNKITNGGQYQGNFHLLASDSSGFCLDASPGRRVRSGEVKKQSRFSRCKSVINQMWELHDDGTLVSRYSGLCAVAKKVRANANQAGSRSWVATGRQGQVYVAFFNLNSQETTITAQIPDIAKVVPGVKTTSCQYYEVWSTQHFGPTETIKAEVERHGAALFVLTCV